MLTFILAYVVILCCSVNGSHFRGGTISWKYVGPGHQVEFKYKLAWALGHESSSSWIAVSHNSTETIHTGRYAQTANNTAEDWEEGKLTFRYNFTSAGPYNVSFSGGLWIALGNGRGEGSWKLETTVDLHVRNDTSTANQSPQATNRAIYRVQYDCDVTIHIPVVDADGDHIRCRWASFEEALSIARILPNASLDQSLCRVSFTANGANGYMSDEWYAFAVIIEDFPRKTITINGQSYQPDSPISQIPLQFLVRPETMNGSCNDKPVFVTTTLPEGHIIWLKAGDTFRTSYFVHSNSGVKDIDITGNTALSIPPILADDHGRQNVWKVNISWTPTQTEKGTHIICATAEDNNWKLSDSRCISVVTWGIDHCSSFPCLNGGICENRFRGFNCSCPNHLHGDLCEYGDFNETEDCAGLEYTECTCRITSPRLFTEKSYVTVSGAVGMTIGLLATIAVYIAWSVCGQNYPNCRSLNKVQTEEDRLINEDESETPCIDTRSEATEQCNETDSKNHIKDIKEGCQCFVDHTGYNHFQRRTKDDKHNYRYHSCRSRQSNQNASHRSSKY